MEAGTVLAIAIPVLVLLAGLAVFTAGRKTDARDAVGFLSRETRKRDQAVKLTDLGSSSKGAEVEKAAALERVGASVPATVDRSGVPERWVPPDEDAIGVARRQFLNRGIIGLFILGISGFGGAALAFVWPRLGGGFGAKIAVGKLDDLVTEANNTSTPVYRPEARTYIQPYPSGALEAARAVYPDSLIPGMEAGVVALYQKCPHLGCRVPWCDTSQWFECPCHGSQYNAVGEKRGGPAPRGMDRFPVSVGDDGTVTVDTGLVVPGPEIGIDTTGQSAEGPNCVGSGSH